MEFQSPKAKKSKTGILYFLHIPQFEVLFSAEPFLKQTVVTVVLKALPLITEQL